MLGGLFHLSDCIKKINYQNFVNVGFLKYNEKKMN